MRSLKQMVTIIVKTHYRYPDRMIFSINFQRHSGHPLENRKFTVRNAKNNETRVIPINQTLYQELLNLSESSDGEYVFTNGDDRPFGDIKKGFSATLKRTGIEDFHFHDLRHTFGSHLVMQGVDLKTVQQAMGHKDIKMTMRYSHLSPEYVQEAIDRLDNV